MSVFVFASLLGACGGGGGNSSEDTDGGVAAEDAARSDAGASDPSDPSDLGAGCPGGCNLSTCVIENDDCEGGVCVWHGEFGAAYCSRPCLESCRPGYSCLQTEDESGPVCLSDTPDCGNGAIEYGELCDDGNTDAGDLCSPGCTEITELPSSGTITTTINDGSATTSTGSEPTVVAHRIDERLFFDTSESSFSYALPLADDAGPAPYNTLIEVGLIENVGGTTCSFAGSTFANISALDIASKTLEGGAELQMTCLGGCDFGCTPMFNLEVAFALNWVER